MAHTTPDSGVVVPLDETEGVGEYWQNSVDVLAVGVVGIGGPTLLLGWS
jgi:hypothetical protein